MKLELLPLLQTQRDLYEVPRGPARFGAYLEAMTGGGEDLVLPLAGMNPLGKEHVAALVDSLLAWDAEARVAEVLAVASDQLGGFDGVLKVGLVLTDDLGGGWTNRYLSDMTQRFKNAYDLENRWALVPVWTSQVWTPAALEQAVLSTVYRTVYKQVHGLPVTLAEMLEQEGRALDFAGVTFALEPDDLEYSRAVLGPYTSATEWAVILPCLYGDAAARSVGHPPLGLSPNAGYAVALSGARREAGSGLTRRPDVLLTAP